MQLVARALKSFAVVGVLLTSSCVAQQPGKPASAPFVLEAGELMLGDLVARCAAHLGWNVLCNENEMQQATGGQVFKFQRRIETDAAGCEELFSSLLYQRGLALLELDGKRQLYEVVFMSGPRAREVMNRAPLVTPEEVLARPELRRPVLTVVALKHINANIATNALRPFFAQAGAVSGPGGLTFGTVGNSSSLLLMGFQDQVAAAVRMVQIADVPGREKSESEELTERVQKLEARVRALEQGSEKK